MSARALLLGLLVALLFLARPAAAQDPVEAAFGIVGASAEGSVTEGPELAVGSLHRSDARPCARRDGNAGAGYPRPAP